jgi:hypothetical protein
MEISESFVVADHVQTHDNATLFALGCSPLLSTFASCVLLLSTFNLAKSVRPCHR